MVSLVIFELKSSNKLGMMKATHLEPTTRNTRIAGIRVFTALSVGLAATLVLAVMEAVVQRASASAGDAQATVAALDKEYQAAVKRNNAATMARILADDFVLVTGSGKTYNKEDMLSDARSGATNYERNDEDAQTVRVWGDTAVVTAKLWEKYTVNGKSVDHKFWFSDTYVRTPSGWKYVFGQSSLPLPVKAPETD
jgi:ketosteroid isomerase-like protein